MKLLLITQKVDIQDPVLGFMHRWITEFAKQFEHIQVVCLYEGQHSLPRNVTVHSLGKETGESKRKYISRLYSYAYTLRKEYDAVLVHMNPEYIVLLGLFFKFIRKNVYLWYNHEKGGILLSIASLFTRSIFHTSPYAVSSRFKQSIRMPAGIDTTLFSPKEVQKIPQSVYFQGRIAPAKNVHILIEAFTRLFHTGVLKRLTLVGPEDTSYTASIRETYTSLIDTGSLVFLGSRQNEETPDLYSSHSVSVNLTADGNYDKTVLESLACNTPVIVASKAFSNIPDVTVIPECTVEALVKALEEVPIATRQGREYVENEHSLSTLASRLKETIR